MTLIVAFSGQVKSADVDPHAESVLEVQGQARVSLGIVPFGSTQTHAFALKNTSDRPVRIDSIRTSCGCSEAFSSSERVNPGESVAITLVMKVDTIQPRLAHAWVLEGTGEQANALAQLTLSASPDKSQRLILRPHESTLNSDNTFSGSLRLSYPSGLDPTGFSIDMPEWLELAGPQIEEAQDHSLRQESAYQLRVRSNAPRGPLTGEIRFLHEDSNYEAVSRVHVAHRSPLSAHPSVAYMGTVSSEDVEVELRISGDLEVLEEQRGSNLEMSDPRVKIVSTRLTSDVLGITLRVSPGDFHPGERIQATLDVVSPTGGALLSVPVSGMVTAEN